jgi:hypothetical protein
MAISRPYLEKSSMKNLSGDMNSTLIFFSVIACSTAFFVAGGCCELIAAPGMNSGSLLS